MCPASFLNIPPRSANEFPMQETIPIETQIRGLGQKYLGARPDTHEQAIFQGGNMEIEKDHPLPISNFMNAQCSYIP